MSKSLLQYNLGKTNFHVHGIHASTGVPSQENAGEYVGGDNIFVKIDGKDRPDDTPRVLTFFGELSEDHLPGVFMCEVSGGRVHV